MQTFVQLRTKQSALNNLFIFIAEPTLSVPSHS